MDELMTQASLFTLSTPKHINAMYIMDATTSAGFATTPMLVHTGLIRNARAHCAHPTGGTRQSITKTINIMYGTDAT